MEVDQSIVLLAARLDRWFEGNHATFASQDVAAQSEALLHGFEIVKELDRLKADGIAALGRLLQADGSATHDERAANLTRGFEFAARLADTLHDELLDTNGETKIWRLMDEIVKGLDAFGSGRAALAVLFDHPDAAVRASAGAYLVDLMPDRVVPMLRTIEERNDASCALFRAHWALLAWKLDGKSRFNSLDEKHE
jgi:hypothetical protein